MRTDIVYDIETEGLLPIQDRIVAIGCKTIETEVYFIDDDEAQLLKNFWQFIRSFDNIRLIGFNNSNFDNNFLLIRSLKHRIPIIDIRSKSFDLRYLLNGNCYAKGTLNDYTVAFGLGTKNGDGQLVIFYTKEELKKYLENDIHLTWSLFQLIKSCEVIT